MLNYLKEHIKAEPFAALTLVFLVLSGGIAGWFQWHVFRTSSSTELRFVCNDASNSNGYVSKNGAYLLIEVLCKVTNLGSRNISIDHYEGLYYWNNKPYSNKGHFVEDEINASVLKGSDYFKVPFPIAPGDQKNVHLFIQVPIGYKDRNKGLSECSTNESLTVLAILNNCFDNKIQKPIPNYIYESMVTALNDIGLRVHASDSKSYDSKIPLGYLAYRANESIAKLSSRRDIPNFDKWFIKEIRHELTGGGSEYEYIDIRQAIASIVFSFVVGISYIVFRFKYGKVLFEKHKKIQFMYDSLILLVFLSFILISSLFLLFRVNILYVLFR